MAIVEVESLSLSDGSTVKVAMTPNMTADEWKETKSYLAANPDEGRKWETFSKDAKAVKTWMQQRAFQEYYQTKLEEGDEEVYSKLMSLTGQPEFAPMFDSVRRGGMTVALQHSYNEPLMSKVNRAVGGIPSDMKETMSKILASPVTLHEACKLGDVKAVEEYIKSGTADLEAKDAKGITCLGYAVGANRISVVKTLLAQKADAKAVDSNGGTALHYAAAYGRKDLLDFLIKGGLDVNAKMADGSTPLSMATKNKQKDTMEILKSKGAA